ncbi:MAG: ATP-binding protein [Desulfatiglandaceae bacterium]
MFLSNLRKIPGTIGFRLTAWYSGIFILVSLLLFGVAYFLLSSTLEKHDHGLIRLRSKEVSALYENAGISALENELASIKKFPRKKDFFIRIADAKNRTLFLNFGHQWSGFDIKALEKAPPGENPEWMRLPFAKGENAMDILSTRLRDDHWLQVGKSSEEREKLLERFRETLAAVIILLVILGFAGGAFLAFRALRPIRNLIQAVRSVETGAMDARVPSPRTGDELDELVRLFNGMLAKIETLIRGMKDALDNVAHDLRTPMTRLRGIAEMAIQSEQTGDECRETLGRCIEESEQILTMLNTLMDISEAETGAMKLDRGEVRISELLASAADLYACVAEDQNIDLHVSAPKHLVLRADVTRMAQVLANLLDNAIKYSPEGGGSIELGARQGKNILLISVVDQGIGIPEEDIPRIWDRLYRGDHSRHQRGLGLGLSLVRAVVKAHGGSITVESAPGKGSTFTIRLPATAQSTNISQG